MDMKWGWANIVWSYSLSDVINGPKQHLPTSFPKISSLIFHFPCTQFLASSCFSILFGWSTHLGVSRGRHLHVACSTPLAMKGSTCYYRGHFKGLKSPSFFPSGLGPAAAWGVWEVGLLLHAGELPEQAHCSHSRSSPPRCPSCSPRP